MDKELGNRLLIGEYLPTLDTKIVAFPFSKARGLQRFIFAGAVVVEPDKQERILVPQNLREYTPIQKDVMIIGASNRAETWDKMVTAMEELKFQEFQEF